MMHHLSESTFVIREPGDKAIPRPRGRPRLRVLSRAASDEPQPEATVPNLPGPLAVLDRMYSAAFGFVVHPLVNQRARSVPLVLEHAADLAVMRRALELVAAEGGFAARIRHVWQLEASVRSSGSLAAGDFAARLREQTDELLQLAAQAIPPCARGEAPLRLEFLPSSRDEVRLRLQLEASDNDHESLEASLHDAARAIAPFLIRLSGVRPSVRVSRRAGERARVSCRIQRERLLASALQLAGLDGCPSAERAVDRATAALAAGAADAAIAGAHNAVVEHGIAAVALALGNAPTRITRCLEQHAARWGRCAPLCSWTAQGDSVEGELELPVELAMHGRKPTAEPSGDGAATFDRARDIALLAACMGMAASIIALEDAVRARALERTRPLPPPRGRRRAACVQSSR